MKKEKLIKRTNEFAHLRNKQFLTAIFITSRKTARNIK